MSTLFRRAAVLTCAAAVGSVLPALTAASAVAAEGDFTATLRLVDSNNDGLYGVASIFPSPLPESATRDVEELATSVGSARFLTAETTYTTQGAPTGTKVVAHDADSQGTVVRTVDSVAAGQTFVAGLALSPDGNRAAWTRVTPSASGVVVQTKEMSLGSGATRTLPASTVAAGYLDSTTLLLQSTENGTWSASSAAGSVAPVSGIPAEAFDVRTNLDGSKLVWARDTSTSDVSTSDIQTAAFDRGALTASNVLTVASGQANESPVFTADGDVTEVSFVKWDGESGNGDIWRVIADGASQAYSDGTYADEVGLSAYRANEVAPGTATALPVQLAGTSARVSWTLPGDSDLSGVLVYRYAGDQATYQQKSVFVPAPATVFTDTGLVVGQTYRYLVVAKDRSGNGASNDASSRYLTAAAAAPTAADPTSRTTTRAPFPVRFATATAATVTYTVDYSANGGAFRPWVSGVAGVQRTFGSPAGTGVAATTSTPGQTYRFRVVAHDGYGNSTAPVVSGKTVVPLDQTKATLSGGANVARSDAWSGTLRTLKRTTDYARIAVTGSRFQLVVERCTTCGVVDVFDGSTRIGSVDTKAASRQARQVVFTKTWAAVGNHTITVRPRATAGRPSVQVDAFAVLR